MHDPEKVWMRYQELREPGGPGMSGGARLFHVSKLSADPDTAELSRLFAPQKRSPGKVSLHAVTRFYPSASIAQASERGVLDRELSPDNKDIAFGGDKAKLKEVWLEICKKAHEGYPEKIPIPHFHLCFSTNKSPNHYFACYPCFVISGGRSCFSPTSSGEFAVFSSSPLSSRPALPVSVTSSDFERRIVFSAGEK